MPCFHPLNGFYDKFNKKMYFGTIPKEVLLFHPFDIEEMSVPCGRCIGCRLEYSRKWACRCVHEASLYDENSFITLTYDDDHLPDGKTLVKRDLQLFIKRLRKKYGAGIRFFACGEYGDLTFRPHYHIILFNFSPPDYKVGKKDLNLDPLSFSTNWSKLCVRDYGNSLSHLECSSPCSSYSASLSQLWSKGHVVVGEVTFESCAYVARYCVKKITGEKAAEYYNGRLPEFIVMSRRPGIGGDWIEKYYKETFDNDTVLARGVPCKPPRFYDNFLEKVDPDRLEEIKENRRKFAKSKENELTNVRLFAMEQCLKDRQEKKSKKL